MHEQRGQFPVLAETRRNLERALNQSVLAAQLACCKVSISLPNYALSLIPRLRYSQGGDERPFPYQFLVFFTPSAKRIRGVRIGRVCAVLDATTNTAHAMEHGPGSWPVGEPVGISIDVDELTEEDKELLAAYMALGVQLEGETTGLNLTPPPLELAKERVVGKVLGKAALIVEVPHDTPGFFPASGTDDDVLDYATIDPNHDEHGLDADGIVKTREVRREEEDFAYMEEATAPQEEDHPMEEDPAPPYVQTAPEAEAFTTTALQVSLEEPAGGVLPQALTPTSAVESIPSSEAVLAASSTQDLGAPSTRRSTVGARRSRNYRGPYVQPASSSSSSRSRPPPSRRTPSPRRHPPSRSASSQQYSPPGRHSFRRSPSPSYSPRYRRSPSPPAAAMGPLRGRSLQGAPGVRIIQTREQHRIVQDMDTGISALVPIMQVSSSQMGLDLSTLMQPVIPEGARGRIGPQGYAPLRPIEDSRGSSGSRYHPRSRSPRRDYHSRPRSPSPRRSDYNSGFHSSRSGSRRSPPRRFQPPHRRSPRPDPVRQQGPEPTQQDLIAAWGVSTAEPGLGWGSTTTVPAADPPSTLTNPALPSPSAPGVTIAPAVEPTSIRTNSALPPPSTPTGPTATDSTSTPGAGPSSVTGNRDE